MIEPQTHDESSRPLLETRRIALQAALFFLTLASTTGSAYGWNSARQAYPGSIRAVAVQAASPRRDGRPAIVRTALTSAERGAQMTFEVALAMRNFAELQARIARGELVPAQEMDARYFPLQSDYDRVVQWVKDQGFTVTRTDANKLAVFARGSVDSTAAAFQVSFARVSYLGAEYSSAVTEPSIPAELSPIVLGIHGLQPHLRPRPMVHLKPMVNGFTGYAPSQILKAYGAGSIAQDGTGQTIAMVEQVFPLLSDLTTFWTDAGVVNSTGKVQMIPVGVGPDPSTETNYYPELEEADLDAEWASAIAPGAHLRIYGAGTSDSGSFDEAYQQIYKDLSSYPQIHQLSLSFGSIEDELDHDYFLIESQYMANLTAAGVTVFVASGDGGAQPDPVTGQYNVNAPVQVTYPASDPSVTGVGGTHLVLNPDNSIEGETGWSGSGGGVSTIYARPAWQAGASVPAGAFRMVPDIAAVADLDPGALVVDQGTPQTIGGTSWSTPTWAGFCALINQARGTPVGFLNPKLYALQGTSALMDIVSGGNATYPAAAGYDMSTGLGTPNVANLIQLLGNAPGPLAILDQLGPQFVTPGQTATFAVATWPPAGGGAIPTNPGFQWQRMPAGGASWANLEDDATHSGSLTPLLAVFGVTPSMTGDRFQCVVSDGSSTVTSAPAALTVGATGVTTLAGWPEAAGTADGIGRLARFDFVGSVRLDSKGNIYAVDAGNDTIRRITPQGVVTTFAGTPGMTGSTDGPVASALFDDPGGVAVDPKGNVFVADSGNYTVREISTAGQVATLAGSQGAQGTADGTGSNARFFNMQNIAADSLGNLYVVDGTSDTVRKIVIATGAVTTIAGSPGVVGSNDDQGNYALFNNPTGVATDALGNIYVSDTGNDKIRKITPTGAVTTIATIAPYQGPNDTVQAASSAPAGLGVDASGNIFVGCTGDNTVREIAPGGAVSVVAGEGGDPENVDGPLATARFGFPDDIAVDSSGVLYVADGINNTVRRILQNAIAPIITVQPTSQTVAMGSTVVLSASVTGAVSYQWMDYGSLVSNGAGAPNLNADVVSGANGPVLVISNVSYLSNGTYTLVATGPDGGMISSSLATISVVASTSPGAVTSLSSRAFVGTGDDILIGGFYVVGNTSATVLVQAIGPGIGVSPYNVSGVLQHPEVAIHQNQNGKDVVLYDNAGWGSSQVLLNAAAAVYALPVLSPGSPDSELLVTLPPGGYTAEVTGADGGTGVALCAIYQLP